MKFDFLSESDQAYFIHKASTLVEALPYIREHSGQKIVIKYGGHAMGNNELSQNFSKDIAKNFDAYVMPDDAISTARVVHALYSSDEKQNWVYLNENPISVRLGRKN